MPASLVNLATKSPGSEVAGIQDAFARVSARSGLCSAAYQHKQSATHSTTLAKAPAVVIIHLWTASISLDDEETSSAKYFLTTDGL